MNDSGTTRFNDLSSPLALLRTRRSGRPREMTTPGPSPNELRQILEIAARVPDHGKLHPWRFVVIEDRRRFADLLVETFRSERPNSGSSELEPVRQFAQQAPALVVVMSAPVPSAKIPVWEQELSAGAACMNLLHAAHALGFTGGWVTGWATYSPGIIAALGEPGERIAGFIFLGTPSRALEERSRPQLEHVVRRWG